MCRWSKPFGGRLSNGGETVSLLRPDNTQGIGQEDAGYVPYIPVESIGYENSEPWPDDADGTGLSLQRITGSKFGDDLKNWLSAAPTAGRKNADAAAGDRDTDGMSDAWRWRTTRSANAAPGRYRQRRNQPLGIPQRHRPERCQRPIHHRVDQRDGRSCGHHRVRIARQALSRRDIRHRRRRLGTVGRIHTDAGQTSAKFESNAAPGQPDSTASCSWE